MSLTNNKWFALIKLLAPIILTTVKPELAPIADKITDGMVEAEELKAAGTITDKMGHVQNIGSNAADVINTAKGREVVDKSALSSAISQAVSTAISAVNVVAKAS